MDQTLILELSSDEELGLDNSSTADNFDWITHLFEDDPPDTNQGSLHPCYRDSDDGSDDVVVVGEVIVQKPKKPISSVLRNCVDDDDDDCVVLDGDPDKPKDDKVKDCNNNFKKKSDKDEDDSDDLLIVGEKGQVACRDFPHARHSCAKFPFSSTAHESRCDLCHCYVCDLLAPCAHWGSGDLSTDHCHATDKEEHWKRERTRFRQMKNPSPHPMAVTKPIVGSLSQSPQLHHISRGSNQLLRLSTNNVISSTFVPRAFGRRQRSSIAFQPNAFSRNLARCCNSVDVQIQGNKGPSLLSRTRLVSSRPMFKRSGVTNRPVGAEHQPACHSLNNVSVAYLPVPNQPFAGQLAENNSANSTVSSLHSELNPFLPSNTSNYCSATSLNMRGHNHLSPCTPTSQYNGYGHSTGLVSNNNSYTYAPMNQFKNVPGHALPVHSEQHSALMQNGSGPATDGFSNITLQSQQISTQQSYNNPVISSTMTNAWNFVTSSGCQQPAVEGSTVRGAVPMAELLPSIEHDKPPSCFDMDYLLNDDGSVFVSQEESFMFDVNNQSSGAEPVDAGMLYFDFETSMKGLTHL